MTEQPEQNSNLENLAFLLASFTDNGRSLRAFTANPQELAITIITAGLLANTSGLEQINLSATGNNRAENSAGPTHQPDRNPGAACDFEIDAVTTTRSAKSAISKGDTNSAPSNTSSS